ncbi:hypothetical protein E6O75_ATG00332 [Venturia nashicola]|uniref:Uncharacterized protein n=1 Tax=Venturia nashicola TaxID=86259 RepID=A0A4Z1PDH6_9PEZI|nr:hypothetical protein E6O75_ATG00332 [Venturia nashicola]
MIVRGIKEGSSRVGRFDGYMDCISFRLHPLQCQIATALCIFFPKRHWVLGMIMVLVAATVLWNNVPQAPSPLAVMPSLFVEQKTRSSQQDVPDSSSVPVRVSSFLLLSSCHSFRSALG